MGIIFEHVIGADVTRISEDNFLVYAPRGGLLRFIARCFFPGGRVLDAKSGVDLLPDKPPVHLPDAWRRWEVVGDLVVAAGFMDGSVRRLGINIDLAEVFTKQRVLRRYMDEFSAAYSVAYFNQREVVLLVPASAAMLSIFKSAAARQPTRTNLRLQLLFGIASIASTLTGFLRSFSGLIKSVKLAVLMLARRLLVGPFCGPRPTIIFCGHSNSSGQDPEKLSEVNFWGEVAERSREIGGSPLDVLILDGTGKPTRERSDGVYSASSIFDLEVTSTFKESMGLVGRVLRIWCDGLRHNDFQLMADDILSQIASTIIAILKPHYLVTTISTLRGDCVFEGAALAKVERAIIYYSTNTSLITADENGDLPENPAFKLRRGDMHFSWGDGMTRWLTGRVGIPEAQVVLAGPLMFASTRTVIAKPTREGPRRKLCVGLFDVTPVLPVCAFRLGLGRGIYPSDWCLTFFRDVVAACKSVFGDDLCILVKFKRELNPGLHDLMYVDALERILRELGDTLVQLAPDSNPWNAVASCDVVVGMPYTSMVEAGAYLGKKACFYRPTGTREPAMAQGIPSFETAETLQTWLAGVASEIVELESGKGDDVSERLCLLRDRLAMYPWSHTENMFFSGDFGRKSF